PEYKQRLDDLTESLRRGLENIIKEKRQQFELGVSRLQALNPLDILRRGYSITVKLPTQAIIKNVKSLQVGDSISTRLQKGSFISVVKGVDDEV
ncbi:exodeoxyribonuclease VII large subunit, partial [Candidatus Omnitrophota bacterium]